MAGGGTLDMHGQIQALVTDKLQVVSYKWLSRNFSVSSNYAKRLLQEFVEKHGNELEVLYTLSGWLKQSPQTYSIRLASGPNLPEVKQNFKDKCSVQVYSVQSCIPKDLAVLWNAEFVQAEEFSSQPPSTENCFRDNRFCGVSNSSVKRVVDGKPLGDSLQQPKSSTGYDVQYKTNVMLKDPPVQSPQQERVGQPSAKNSVQPCTAPTMGDTSDMISLKINNQTSKIRVVKESAPAQVSKRKSQNEKLSAGTSGSLASMWGRASTKSKPLSPTKETNVSANLAYSAEAQTGLHESAYAVNSDDECQDVNTKRGASSRKRRVVIDFSDDENDEENAASLPSPDPPFVPPVLDSVRNTGNTNLDKKIMNFEDKGADILDVKKTLREEQFSAESDVRGECKSMNVGISLQEKIQSCVPEHLADEIIKDKANNSASTSPKRRKILKTRIDERGREVAEVVWEGEAAGSANTDKSMATNDVGSRAPTTNKAPAAAGSCAPSNPTSKDGNKKLAKGSGKDPKQGNILSFFKKV